MILKGKKIFLVCLLAGLWACNNDSENINDEITAEDAENVASMDEATTQYADAVTVSNEILSDMGVMNGRTQQCHTVEETGENQVLVTFENACLNEDGRYRSGSMTINWIGDSSSPDFSYTVTFSEYTVDGYILDGSITVSDLIYEQSSLSFSVVVNDGNLICPDGRQLTYEQDLTYTFSYNETIDLTIEGSITGTNKDGISYIANTQDPILVVAGCDHAVSGSFSATFNGRLAVTVDYGDGTCDDQATLSRGNRSLDITLD